MKHALQSASGTAPAEVHGVESDGARDGLATLLRGIVGELISTAERLDDAQAASSTMAAAEMDAELVTRLQAFDLIDQTLRNLAGVLEAIAMAAAMGQRIGADVTTGCTLSGLARRLAGAQPHPPGEDVDFF